MDNELLDAFKIERKILSFGGVYPNRKKHSRLSYGMKRFFNLGSATIQMISTLMFVYYSLDDLSKVTGAMLFVVPITCTVFKMFTFIMQDKHLTVAERILTDESFNDFSHKQMEIIRKSIGTANLLGHVFRIMCIVCLFSFIAYLIIDNNTEHPLVVPGWYPWDVYEYHIATLVFQVVALSSGMVINVSLDILTVKLITLGSVQFDTLIDNFTNMDYNQYEEVVNRLLRKHVIHHVNLREYLIAVGNLFTYGIFAQFVGSIIVIGFTGFQMVITPIYTFEYLTLLILLITMFVQISMYCWFGQIILTKSETIGDSVYATNWHAAGISTRKMISIIMECSKRPIILTAGGFYPLTLTTLIMISKSSYSYLALLQRLYGNE